MKIIRNISILLIMAFLMTSGSMFVAAQNADKKSDKDFTAKRIERRIDKLSAVITQKKEEGTDVKKAEDLMVKAMDLFDNKKYEDAMNVLDDVERALGFEPRRFDRQSPGGDQGRPGMGQGMGPGMGPGRPPQQRELSAEERKELKQEVGRLLKEAQTMIEKENYKEAFELLMNANRNVADLAGIMPPMPPMPNGGPGGPFNENGMRPPFGQEFFPGGPGGPGNQGGPFMPPPGQGNPGGPGQGRGPQQGMGRRGGGPGNEWGMGNERPMRDPEKMFQRFREQGEEGWKKASEFCDKTIAKFKEKDIDFDKSTVDKFEKAIKVHDQGKLDEAFDVLHEVYMSLMKSMPRPANKLFGGTGEGPQMGMGPGPRMGFGDLNITKEEREKLESALKSLQENAGKYVEKFGKDDFIIDCFGKYKDAERSLRREEINVEKALGTIGEIDKKIAEKLKQSSKDDGK